MHQASVGNGRSAGRSAVAIEELTVAHIIGRLNIGGAERHCVSLLNATPARKKIAIFVSGESAATNLHDELQGDVIQIQCRVRKRSFLLDIWKLARLLREYDCDVVHSHMYWANLASSCAGRLASVPVVVTTEHGENHWKKPIHRWVERNVISRVADMRFCVSEKIRQQRITKDGIPPPKLALISNGTTMPDWPVDRKTDGRIVIGSIGRFVKQKNLTMLIDAIDLLRRRGLPVYGCLVGDGPEMQAIRESIAARGLEDKIELPGMVTNVDEWYRKFSVYACSSSEEGLPVSIIEAMSYGLPVITTDVGAIATAVRDTVDGFVVPANNVESFADALAKVVEHPDVGAKIGLNGRRRVEEAFSIEAVAESYAGWYCQIAGSKSAFSAA
jgi:glycosyltransferase involved in cell wall biosynthesis